MICVRGRASARFFSSPHLPVSRSRLRHPRDHFPIEKLLFPLARALTSIGEKSSTIDSMGGENHQSRPSAIFHHKGFDPDESSAVAGPCPRTTVTTAGGSSCFTCPLGNRGLRVGRTFFLPKSGHAQNRRDIYRPNLLRFSAPSPPPGGLRGEKDMNNS